jgi:DNA repair ATPase RecN
MAKNLRNKLSPEELAQSKEKLRQEIQKLMDENKKKLEQYEKKHGKIKNHLLKAAKDENYPFSLDIE